MRKIIILIAILAIGAFAYTKLIDRFAPRKAEVPVWLETDSAAAIEARTAADFSLSTEEVLEAIRRDHPEVTEAMLDSFAAAHYVERRMQDGEMRYFRKTARNLGLLCPAYNGGTPPRGAKASPARISYVDSVLDYCRGTNPEGMAHAVVFRFSVDVPGHEAIAGDTLRVWMPYPMTTARQSDVAVLEAQPAGYIVSGDRSPHSSIYFEGIAPQEGDTAHFEYTARFVTRGAFAAAEDIEKNLKPYDTASAEYKKYTAFDNPHIVRLDSLARAIVGDETSPFRQSEMVYDYIINRYPGPAHASTAPYPACPAM